ncbi:hypothetical protein H6P81_000864 [Aristolochia fimbriata]|uniref:Uncharacterized protein n=1 Tax=Aristolochia fimbriata TaxID=158543 RepID=A0AAV7F8G2_ARIFI|nr:hypothetical protein H6P81_000864 [Aristolochia fimbriata]
MLETLGALISVLAVVIILAKIVTVIICYSKRTRRERSAILPDTRFGALDMDKFLDEMEREKPIKFSSEQLRMATGNFNHMLGSGAFGAVYKGVFPNGVLVAVKVLRGNSDKRIEEQFMAESHDSDQPENQVWLPGWAWKAYEKGELRKMLEICGVEMNYREEAERMVMAAMWCVQFQPGLRPNMSTVVKMLGGMEIPAPPNPFPFFPAGSPRADPVPTSILWDSPSSLKSSGLSSELSLMRATPIMRRYEIEIASTLRGK